MTEQTNGFHGLGIAPKFLEILGKNNFTTPTPIQAQAIPVAIQGKDVIGIAQTGTGKTLAFGIPMLQNMVSHKGQGLVLVPTRELAIQVEESINKIGRSIGLRTAVLIGGEDIKRQIRKLRQDPHVIVATPGRLIDHLEHNTAKLNTVKILVLDEADRMFDMGFAPQIKKILAKVPAARQTMLFSATMPQEIVALAVGYMKTPLRVEVAPAGSTAKDVSQELFFVDRADKPQLLQSLLEKYKGSVLVFTRTKYEAKKVAKLVRDMTHSSSEIHSNRSLSQRREALSGFKLGKYRVLVATDIAARGIDVTGIELVINYDLPANAEDYVHRIGRTGRAGKVGHAISLAMPNQKQDVRGIERVIKKSLPVSETGIKTSAAVRTSFSSRSDAPRRSEPYRGGGRNGGRKPQGYADREQRSRPFGKSSYSSSAKSYHESDSRKSSYTHKPQTSSSSTYNREDRKPFKPAAQPMGFSDPKTEKLFSSFVENQGGNIIGRPVRQARAGRSSRDFKRRDSKHAPTKRHGYFPTDEPFVPFKRG